MKMKRSSLAGVLVISSVLLMGQSCGTIGDGEVSETEAQILSTTFQLAVVKVIENTDVTKQQTLDTINVLQDAVDSNEVVQVGELESLFQQTTDLSSYSATDQAMVRNLVQTALGYLNNQTAPTVNSSAGVTAQQVLTWAEQGAQLAPNEA